LIFGHLAEMKVGFVVAHEHIVFQTGHSFALHYSGRKESTSWELVWLLPARLTGSPRRNPDKPLDLPTEPVLELASILYQE
jgi:hypothetical protein